MGVSVPDHGTHAKTAYAPDPATPPRPILELE